MDKPHRSVLTLAIILLLTSLVITPAQTVYTQPETVYIPDEHLETIIRLTLDKPEGELTTEDMKQLTVLDAWMYGRIEDLTGLEYAENLEIVYLFDNKVSNIDALSGLPRLHYLDLNFNDFDDFSRFDGIDLPALEILEMVGNRMKSFSGLAGANMPELRYLDLLENSFRDFSGMEGVSLPALETLILNYGKLEDLNGLAGAYLPSLKDLHLDDNDITNLSGLDGAVLPSLEFLDMCFNNIDCISGIAGAEMPRLQLLCLAFNRIKSLTEFDGLNLPDLENLYLYVNSIEDITGLAEANLPSLKKLFLDANYIVDATGLENVSFPNLELLYLNENHIEKPPDFSIAELTGLKILRLNHNRIEDITGIKRETLPVLEELNLSLNYLDLRENSEAMEVINALKDLETLNEFRYQPQKSLAVHTSPDPESGLHRSLIETRYPITVEITSGEPIDDGLLYLTRYRNCYWSKPIPPGMYSHSYILHTGHSEDLPADSIDNMYFNVNYFYTRYEQSQRVYRYTDGIWKLLPEQGVNTDEQYVWFNTDDFGFYGIFYSTISPGDVNSDGSIDVSDAIMVLRHIVGLEELDEVQQMFADVNNDGFINIQDAILILRHTVGLSLSSL